MYRTSHPWNMSVQMISALEYECTDDSAMEYELQNIAVLEYECTQHLSPGI